jgi:alpha-D-ribose 1-methylphosphonate 5-triphosphate synthase subunit PhnG
MRLAHEFGLPTADADRRLLGAWCDETQPGAAAALQAVLQQRIAAGRTDAQVRLPGLLLQGGDAIVSDKVIAPLEAKLQSARVEASTKAAATKVDFFTMVRGDD